MFMHNAQAFHDAEDIALADLGLSLMSVFPAGGMLATTLVETDVGWRQAGSLKQGMRVQTWDGGLCAIVSAERHFLWPAADAELVRVPGGVLDTCADLWLMPGQEVLLASPVIEEVLDAAGALVPARALAGYRGIRLTPVDRPVEMVSLTLATDELVYANSGALIRATVPARAARGLETCLPQLDGARAAALLALIETGARTTGGLRLAA